MGGCTRIGWHDTLAFHARVLGCMRPRKPASDMVTFALALASKPSILEHTSQVAEDSPQLQWYCEAPQTTVRDTPFSAQRPWCVLQLCVEARGFPYRLIPSMSQPAQHTRNIPDTFARHLHSAHASLQVISGLPPHSALAATRSLHGQSSVGRKRRILALLGDVPRLLRKGTHVESASPCLAPQKPTSTDLVFLSSTLMFVRSPPSAQMQDDGLMYAHFPLCKRSVCLS